MPAGPFSYFCSMRKPRHYLLLRLFFGVVAPPLLLANLVFPGVILDWLAQQLSVDTPWLVDRWFGCLLVVNVSGLRYATKRNNPYLGGFYLALLPFLVGWWLLLGAASVTGGAKT